MDAFVAECPACGERATTEQPNDIVAFYRRHTAVTGHDIVWERYPDEMKAAPVERGLIAVIESLSDGEGVPFGAVSAAMSERGWTVGETLEAVDDHRLTGALWEPRDDHIGVV